MNRVNNIYTQAHNENADEYANRIRPNEMGIYKVLCASSAADRILLCDTQDTQTHTHTQNGGRSYIVHHQLYNKRHAQLARSSHRGRRRRQKCVVPSVSSSIRVRGCSRMFVHNNFIKTRGFTSVPEQSKYACAAQTSSSIFTLSWAFANAKSSDAKWMIIRAHEYRSIYVYCV